jgi:hypothetical protein
MDCYGHGKMHLEYSITQDQKIQSNDKAIHMGVTVKGNLSILQNLPACDHKFMHVFYSEQLEKLLDNKSCDHRLK